MAAQQTPANKPPTNERTQRKRNYGNGGINNNMAAQQTPPTSRLAINARRGSATMVTAE